MSRYGWLSLALWYLLTARVAAQTSNVTTCLPAASWTINSLNQTPCLVAAYLETQCGTITRVDAIPPGTHYVGPTADIADPCKCNTVTYSMISGCAVCQGRTVGNWTEWSQSCSPASITIAGFPRPIPDAVQVPPWAYMNVVTTSNTFVPYFAQLNATGSPPSAAPPPPNPSPSTTSTTTSTTPTSSTASNSATSIPVTSHGPNAGAIAGGVVGGLLFVAAVVLLGSWWFIRKRRNATAVDLTFDQSALVGGSGVMTQVEPSFRDGVSPPPVSRTPALSGSYYDSSEVDTVPYTPMTSAVYTSPAARRSLESVSASVAAFGGSGHSHSTGNQSLVPLRGYRGAAELS